MKELNYGKDYRYTHDETDGYAVDVAYLPQELSGRQYYLPTDRGLEKKIGEKLEYLRSLEDTGAFKILKDKDTEV
jgi:putative ATPase